MPLEHIAWLAGFLFLVLVNLFHGKRDILFPPLLFSLIWTGTFALYALQTLELDQVRTNTIALVFAGTASFSLGGIVAVRMFRKFLNPSGRRPLAVTPRGVPVPFKYILLLLCIGALPLFAMEVQRLSASSGFDSFLVGARVAMAQASESGSTYSDPLFSNLPTVAIFVSFIFLIEKRSGRGETLWYLLSVAGALAYSILTTGRSTLLTLVSGSICIYLLKNREGSLRNIVVGTLLTFALMNVLVFVTKDLSMYEDKGIFEIVWFFIASYIVGPLAALDKVVNDPSVPASVVNHTFSPIMRLVAALTGIDYRPPPILDESVFVPFQMNVYTVFKFYYLDFGALGVLIVMWLIGFVQTWLFVRARATHTLFVFLFAVSMYPLLTCFVDDAYFQFIYWLKTAFIGFVYFRLLRRINILPGFSGGMPLAGGRGA